MPSQKDFLFARQLIRFAETDHKWVGQIKEQDLAKALELVPEPSEPTLHEDLIPLNWLTRKGAFRRDRNKWRTSVGIVVPNTPQLPPIPQVRLLPLQSQGAPQTPSREQSLTNTNQGLADRQDVDQGLSQATHSSDNIINNAPDNHTVNTINNAPDNRTVDVINNVPDDHIVDTDIVCLNKRQQALGLYHIIKELPT